MRHKQWFLPRHLHFFSVFSPTISKSELNLKSKFNDYVLLLRLPYFYLLLMAGAEETETIKFVSQLIFYNHISYKSRWRKLNGKEITHTFYCSNAMEGGFDDFECLWIWKFVLSLNLEKFENFLLSHSYTLFHSLPLSFTLFHSLPLSFTLIWTLSSLNLEKNEYFLLSHSFTLFHSLPLSFERFQFYTFQLASTFFELF